MSAAARIRQELVRSTNALANAMDLVGKAGIPMRQAATVRAALRQQIYRNRETLEAWDADCAGGLLAGSNSTPPEQDVGR